MAPFNQSCTTMPLPHASMDCSSTMSITSAILDHAINHLATKHRHTVKVKPPGPPGDQVVPSLT